MCEFLILFNNLCFPFRLLPHIVGNIGFVFTSAELVEIRDILLSNKKEAPAKAGAMAPLDVFVPPGNTGQGPEKTSFFQALAIPTKITKGTIEILSDIHLIKKDEKVKIIFCLAFYKPVLKFKANFNIIWYICPRY